MTGRRLVISNRAKNDIRNIHLYLTENWSESVERKFWKQLAHTVKLLRENPSLFPETDLPGYYKAVVTKHNSIFYSYNSSSVKIIRVFDTRLHPKKRRL